MDARYGSLKSNYIIWNDKNFQPILAFKGQLWPLQAAEIVLWPLKASGVNLKVLGWNPLYEGKQNGQTVIGERQFLKKKKKEKKMEKEKIQKGKRMASVCLTAPKQ